MVSGSCLCAIVKHLLLWDDIVSLDERGNRDAGRGKPEVKEEMC